MKNQRKQIGVVLVAVVIFIIASLVVQNARRNVVIEDYLVVTSTPNKAQLQMTQVAIQVAESYQISRRYHSQQIAINPHDGSLYYNRAMNYIIEKNYWLAILDLDRAIQLDNARFGLDDLYRQRAYAYEELNAYQLATDDYTRAIKIASEDANLYYKRGYVLSKLGRYDEAIADFTQSLALYPTHARAHYRRGVIYEDREHYDEAIADYTRAIELDSRYTAPLIGRGNIYVALGDYTEARADYDRVLAIEPNHEVAFLNIGVIYNRLDDNQNAYIYYSRAIEADPEYAYPYLYRAQILYELGDFDRAASDFLRYEHFADAPLPRQYSTLRQWVYSYVGW